MTWEEEDRRLVIIAAAELNDYLDSSVLLWPLSKSAGMLTPGSLRLAMMRKETTQMTADLQKAIGVIASTISKRIAIWERKMQEEIPYRLRLWENLVEEYAEEGLFDASIKTQVRNRVILEILFDECRMVDPRARTRLEKIDHEVNLISKAGPFLWDTSVVEVFPREKYWFLYLLTGNTI